MLTLQLKDSSGNLIGNERTIDLPLETMVVDGEYDPQTQKIKLELKNGNYVEFSVADLVSGLQTELSSSNKLDPTYIAYDATHRAVSDTEKDTWSGKQNAISDLETIRSGAAAGASAVQPATMESALSGKQNALTTTQMNAVDSGIDSTKVSQISTNQANILYNLNMSVKNILPVLFESRTTYGVTCTNNGDGSITVNGTNSQSSGTIIIANVQSIVYDGYGDPRNFLGKNRNCVCIGNTTTANLRIQILGWNSSSDNSIIASSTTDAVSFNTGNWNYISVRIWVQGSATFNNVVIKPMICTEAAWNQSHDYQSPALSNSDLTRLQSEDRAGLVECVDGGAKNVLDTSATALKALTSNTEGTWNGNVYTVANVGTVTVNADNSLTIVKTGTSARLIFRLTNTNTSGSKYANMVLSGCPANGSDDTYNMIAELSVSPYTNLAKDYGAGGVIASSSSNMYVYLQLKASYTTGSGGITFKPMVCTLADWKVSQKHVPYKYPSPTSIALQTESFNVVAANTYYKIFEQFVGGDSTNRLYKISAAAMYAGARPAALKVTLQSQTAGSTETIAREITADTDIAFLSTDYIWRSYGGTIRVYASFKAVTNKGAAYLIIDQYKV